MKAFYRNILVCMALLLSACSTQASPWSSLVETRKMLQQHPDPNDASYDKLDQQAHQQAKRILCLGDGQRCHQAASVYFCDRLTKEGDEPALRCISTVADDMIHTTEFPPFPSIAHHSSGLKINIQLEGNWLKQVFLGEPGRMHSVGYREVTLLSVDQNGRLRLPRIQKTMLLGVIVALPGGEFAKYVWVLKP